MQSPSFHKKVLYFRIPMIWADQPLVTKRACVSLAEAAARDYFGS